jgi:hypothetical protein
MKSIFFALSFPFKVLLNDFELADLSESLSISLIFHLIQKVVVLPAEFNRIKLLPIVLEEPWGRKLVHEHSLYVFPKEAILRLIWFH